MLRLDRLFRTILQSGHNSLPRDPLEFPVVAVTLYRYSSVL